MREGDFYFTDNVSMAQEVSRSENRLPRPALASTDAKLTPRQKLFVENLLKGMDATDAYCNAGYSSRGARQSALRLLGCEAVAAELERRRGYVAEEFPGLTAEDIIRGLASEARGEGPDTTASSRISAWRTLADIHGLLGGNSPDLPEGLVTMLEALARGAREK